MSDGSFPIRLQDADAANLRVICGRAMSDEVTADPKWRAEAGRLYDLIGAARDAAHPGGDKSAPFRPKA